MVQYSPDQSVALSFVIPVYNEEKILEQNTIVLHDFLTHHPCVRGFEILLCENGSTDATLPIARRIEARLPNLSVFSLPQQALGAAIHEGIQHARHPFFFLEAIDLPFGLEGIETPIRTIINGYDIVLRSKNHPDSVMNLPARRRMFTRLYNSLVCLLFRTSISDMNGGGIFRKSVVENYLDSFREHGPFFQTQLVLYAQLFTDRICEIPVSYLNPRGDSKMKMRHAFIVLQSLFRELPRYRTYKKRCKTV
ncbi:MAG: glycosyltransferase family 2 protein [Candidatus Kerfeldbacteria bacterium]|nr:glycosyltransferase family 2 protein [Candidatus Kerfeldbacteria bacterium]